MLLLISDVIGPMATMDMEALEDLYGMHSFEDTDDGDDDNDVDNEDEVDDEEEDPNYDPDHDSLEDEDEDEEDPDDSAEQQNDDDNGDEALGVYLSTEEDHERSPARGGNSDEFHFNDSSSILVSNNPAN